MEVKVLKEEGHEYALRGMAYSYKDRALDPDEWWFGQQQKAEKRAPLLAPKDGGHNKFLESIAVWIDVEASRAFWSEFDTYRVGTTKQSECFDSLTEVLTDKGWVRWSEVDKKTLFATRSSDGTFEFQQATHLVADRYVGKMYHFRNSKVDCMVTPNHRFIGSTTPKGKLKSVRADEVRKLFIPKKSLWDADEVSVFTLPAMRVSWDTGCRQCVKEWPEIQVPMDDWLRFIGIYVAQGNTTKGGRNYNINITHNTYDGTEVLIDELLSRLGFVYSKLYPKDTRGVRYTISDKRLYAYAAQFGKSKDKHVPEWCLRLGRRQMGILFDWLCKGDGTKDGAGGYILYGSISPKLAGQVQQMYLMLYGAANIYTRAAKLSSNPQHTVSFQKTDSYCLSASDVSTTDYDGVVYCAEVPNGVLLTRRNGKAIWTSNSTMHTLSKRGPLPEDFEEGTHHAVFDAFCRVWDVAKGDINVLKMNLPEGFLQRRIVCTNYKVLRNIIYQREGHRLKWWKVFIDEVLSQVEHPEYLR